MKIKLTNLNYFTALIIFLIALGLISCTDNKKQMFRVQNSIRHEIVDGNISLKLIATNEDLEIKPCITDYSKTCKPPKGSKLIGEQLMMVKIKAYQKTVNSVWCTVTVEGPGYSYQYSYHHSGNTCE